MSKNATYVYLTEDHTEITGRCNYNKSKNLVTDIEYPVCHPDTILIDEYIIFEGRKIKRFYTKMVHSE